MTSNLGLPLIAPGVLPPLDPVFRPAVLANRAFRAMVGTGSVFVSLALEQPDGSISHFNTRILPEHHPSAEANYTYVERIVKFLLWARGGFRIFFAGPEALAARLAAHYRDTPTGKFDSNLVGERIYEHPIEVVPTSRLPAERN